MNEKLRLQNVAPPPGGLARLQNRLQDGSNVRRPAAWAGAAAAALLLAVSVLLQPGARELPTWAAENPWLRVSDGVETPLLLKQGTATRLAQSAEVTVYLIDVPRISDNPPSN